MKGTIKTVFIGESSTGKTSMVYRLMTDTFHRDTESTIGASFVTIKQDDITYQIWDTAGQERYNSLVPMYCKGAGLIFFVFDLSNPESINRLDFYINNSNIDLDKDVKIIIVGNKLDLVKEVSPIVSGLIDEKMAKYKKLKDKSHYVNVSVKNATNFNELIDKMKLFGEQIIKEKGQTYNSKIIKLTNSKTEDEDKCSC
jgi:small GTP-binding protein